MPPQVPAPTEQLTSIVHPVQALVLLEGGTLLPPQVPAPTEQLTSIVEAASCPDVIKKVNPGSTAEYCRKPGG